MGRIKTALIKRITHELVDKYKKDCTPDFNHNKKVVSSHTDVQSKKIRNTIAGYVSRIMKKEAE